MSICNVGYRYAGLEYRYECFCGDFYYDKYGKVSDHECNETCPGNSSQICGGPWKLSVYDAGETLYKSVLILPIINCSSICDTIISHRMDRVPKSKKYA